MDNLEHFGTPCSLPEPDLIGRCQACSSELYKHEATECICNRIVHTGCIVECLICEAEGCTKCIPKDVESGEHLCEECSEEFNADI